MKSSVYIDNNQNSPELPNNFLAEQMLLGSIMINNDVLFHFNDFLLPEHFYYEIHQKLYKAMLDINNRGFSSTIVNLQEVMQTVDQFKKLDEEQSYLLKLTTVASAVLNPLEYAKLVYRLAIKRSLVNIGQEIILDAKKPILECDPEKQIEMIESKLFVLGSQGVSENKISDLRNCSINALELIAETIKNPSKYYGVPTGFADLEELTGGLKKSDLIILAARPSMGKTSLALNIAVNIAKHFANDPSNSDTVGFISLEMNALQLATRILSMESRINMQKLNVGKLNEIEYNQIRLAHEEIAKLDILIDDSAAMTISAVHRVARRLKRKNNIGVLLIDYLQLILPSRRSDSRVVEITEITQALKALAKTLNIPIIALSQLSRAVESRVDKRPLLSDLRESGSIEQDADMVWFLLREEYYLKNTEPQAATPEHAAWQEKMNLVANKAKIIIAKHRNGPTGSIDVFYDAATSYFGNLKEVEKSRTVEKIL